jgi:hypothetical protein
MMSGSIPTAEEIIKELMTLNEQKKIRLVIDPSLRNNLNRNFRNNQPIMFNFNLFNLIVAIGNCSKVCITRTNKLPFALDFAYAFVKGIDELRVITGQHSEQKGNTSRYGGEGLSRIIAEKLYDLDMSTISRVDRKGRESKPDFEGYSSHLKVVWESKGSIDSPVIQSEIDHAKEQKNNEPANVAFVSLTIFNSQNITEVELRDPEAHPDFGGVLKRRLSRIRHYVNAFNFIGQAEMSRYFELLGKRLKKDKNFFEYPKKIELYKKIKRHYVKLSINERNYLGSVERIGDSEFLYVGFDEKLLNVEDFIAFVDHGEDFTYNQEKNNFRITKDGICYGYLQDLKELHKLGFVEKIDTKKMKSYRDILSILDLDNMLDYQLIGYISDILRKEGFHIKAEPYEDEKRNDIIANKDGKMFIVEVKSGIKRTSLIKAFEQIKNNKETLKAEFAFLVTTMNVSKEDIDFAKSLNIIIIDRKLLKVIIRNKRKLSDFLIGI